MEFDYTDRCRDYQERLLAFMDEHIYPNETVYEEQRLADDFPLASMYAHLRTLRFADGPDEVHKRSIAHQELGRWRTPHASSTTSNRTQKVEVPA
jgi:hypothetical protein